MGGHLLAASAAWNSRLDVEAALAHPVRAAFVEALEARPGLTVGELARAWGVDYKTALHHARQLLRLRLVRVVPDGRVQRLFVAGGGAGGTGVGVGGPFAARAPAAAIPPAPRTLRALRAVGAGACGPALLARALNVPRGTAGSLLEALARRGLVVREGDAWRLSPEIEQALGAGLPPGDAT